MSTNSSSAADSTLSPPNGTAQADVPVRGSDGRWLQGNKAGTGHGGGAKDLARWRRLALEATADKDMLDVWAKLTQCARDGEPWAVHEFLDRTMGKAIPAPPEAQQDVSALMARLWQEWGSTRTGPVEDAQFTAKPTEPAQPEGSG